MTQLAVINVSHARAQIAVASAFTYNRFLEFFTAQMANNASIGTTQLDDRRPEEASLDVAERIGI
jgi:hypothetical protein